MSAKIYVGKKDNLTLYPSPDFHEVYPANTKELNEIVRQAITDKTPLYPISTGHNWGLGSKIPIEVNSLVINLSQINKICEYNRLTGTVIIEPGVTQEQLMNFLKDNGNEHFIDVTGSSKRTSIIGNALERGITYMSQRNESILGLELITGKGDLLKTGSWRLEGTKLHTIYKYGIGPNLTELFFQSNFGIVTKAIIKLPKVKKYNYSLLIQYKSIDKLASSLNCFNELIEDKTINSIFHIANSERAQKTFIPSLESSLTKINCDYDIEKLKKVINKKLDFEWIASGNISSNEKQSIKYKIKMMKKYFSPYATVKIINLETFKLIDQYKNFLTRFNIFKIAYGMIPFKALYRGKATDAAIGSVVEISEFLDSKFNSDIVDSTKNGFSYCLPLLPMTKKDCLSAYKIIQSTCKKFDFNPSVTLNPIKENLLEAVISIKYPPKRYNESRICLRELQQDLNTAGYHSYRTNIKDMDLYFCDENYNDYLKGVKEVFDPLGIISPGRYHPQQKTVNQH